MSGYSLKLDSRKSSWSNFLAREESGTDQSKRVHTQGSRPYNIEDYLPPRTIVGTYASVDHDLEDDYGPGLVMTARFAQAEREVERKKEESHLLQQWKEQQLEIQKLKLAVEAQAEKKKRKMFSFGDRFEWKVHPQKRQVEERAMQTDTVNRQQNHSMSPAGNQSSVNPPATNIVPQQTTIPVNTYTSNAVPNLPMTPITNAITHKTRKASDDLPYRPPLNLLTDRETNIQSLTGRETTRQPLKRIRKEYTQLYPVNVNQINDIVIGLLRCTVGDGL